MLNSLISKSPAQLHPSFIGNDDKSSVSGGLCFMENINVWRNNSLEDLPGEFWKPITGYEGFYEVSNYCRIKSLPRIDCMGQKRKIRILLQSLDKDGYCLIILSKNKDRATSKPHRLGAIEFIPNPLNLPQVNHKNGIKTDCHISNLEWVTARQNCDHAKAMGLSKSMKGQNNRGCVLTNSQVIEIYNSPLRMSELSKIYSIGLLAINRIKIGKTWSWLTGHTYVQKKPSEFLRDELVLEIFKDSSGDRHFLSKKYKIPFYTISNLQMGITYSHITGKHHVKKPRK